MNAAARPDATSVVRVSPMEAALRGSVLPLVRRFQVGEGMLLFINVSVLVAMRPPHALAAGLVSLAVLATMYAVNDLFDAERDVDNPRKDRALASLLLRHRRPLFALMIAEHVAAVVAASCLVNRSCAVAAAATLATNAIYSRLFKGVPVVDVVVVGVWGFAFAAMVAPVLACVAVGAMTSISHVFQAMGDREPDLRAGVTTSAASSRVAFVVLGCASLALAGSLWALIGPPGALAGLVPFGLALAVRRSLAAWLASKVVFGAAWLSVLHGLATSA